MSKFNFNFAGRPGRLPYWLGLAWLYGALLFDGIGALVRPFFTPSLIAISVDLGGKWPTSLARAALFGAWVRPGISEELDDKRR